MNNLQAEDHDAKRSFDSNRDVSDSSLGVNNSRLPILEVRHPKRLFPQLDSTTANYKHLKFKAPSSDKLRE